MRIWLSRELGTLAMGLVELAQSVQMLLLTPLVSALPAAISRMCAQSSRAQAKRVLRIGAAVSLIISVPLCVGAFLLRRPIALWLGDVRTLPALTVTLPCLPVLGISCALNGYFYGTDHPMPPALGELLEQILRFFLCMQLVSLLEGWPVALRAAIPAASTLAGETAGLLLMGVCLLFGTRISKREALRGRRDTLRELFSLALPLTAIRMTTSLMRTVSSQLLPRRLAAAGMTPSQAIAQLGVMQGMLMPILALPSFITCSLCTVAAPELARRQVQGQPIARIVRRSLMAAIGVGACAAAGIWLLAPAIARTFYRQEALLVMLRRCCMMTPLMAAGHICGGLMNGLGMQRASLRIALCANLLCVLLTYVLPALGSLGIYGAIIAQAAAQGVSLLLSLRALGRMIRPEYTSR